MYIRNRLGKWNVEIKRHGYKDIYKTFINKSDAMKRSRSVELQLDQSRYRDDRLDDGVKPTTVSRELSFISVAIKKAEYKMIEKIINRVCVHMWNALTLNRQQFFKGYI